MITETDVPVIVKRLAEAKYPDFANIEDCLDIRRSSE